MGFLSNQTHSIFIKNEDLIDWFVLFCWISTLQTKIQRHLLQPLILWFWNVPWLLAIWSAECHCAPCVSWGLGWLWPAPDVSCMFTSARRSLSCHLPTVYIHRILIPSQRTLVYCSDDTFWKGVHCCSFELPLSWPHLLMDFIPPQQLFIPESLN